MCVRCLHCPACGTNSIKNLNLDDTTFTCPACGEVVPATFSAEQSVCTCPKCTKVFNTPIGNILTNEGEVVDSFDSLTGWTRLNGTGDFALDTTNFRTSNASLKITNVAPDGDTFLIKTVDWDLSDLDTLMIWIYVYQTQALQNDIVRIALSTTTDWSKYVEKTWVYLRQGWNCMVVAKDDMTAYGGEDLADHVVRIRIGAFSGSGSTLIVAFDEFRKNAKNTPVCLLTFDDGRKNIATNALPIMQELEAEHDISIPGTMYLCKLHADLGDAGNSLYLTYAQVKALHDAGWCIANHSLTHPDFLTISDAEVKAELQGCSEWLINLGYVRGAYHHAYPHGHPPASYDVMEECGILSARTVSGGNWYTPTFYPFKMPANTSLGVNYMGLADAKTKMLHAANNGEVCIFTIHGVSDTPTTEELTKAEFRELLEYGISLGMLFLTIDGLSNQLNFNFQ